MKVLSLREAIGNIIRDQQWFLPDYKIIPSAKMKRDCSISWHNLHKYCIKWRERGYISLYTFVYMGIT